LKSPQSSDENDEREWLGQEIIGPDVKRFCFVVFTVLRGEHEDRRPHSVGAQRATDLVAVHSRQQDVEHDRAIFPFARSP
jgi:hypothetical protein